MIQIAPGIFFPTTWNFLQILDLADFIFFTG